MRTPSGCCTLRATRCLRGAGGPQAEIRFATWIVGRQHLALAQSCVDEANVGLQECKAPGSMSFTPKHNWIHADRGRARHGMPAVSLPMDIWQMVSYSSSSSSRWHSMASWSTPSGMRIVASSFYSDSTRSPPRWGREVARCPRRLGGPLGAPASGVLVPRSGRSECRMVGGGGGRSPHWQLRRIDFADMAKY